MYKIIFGGMHAEIIDPDGESVCAQVTPARADILRRLVDRANAAEAMAEALKFYAADDIRSVQYGILGSADQRPATAVLEAWETWQDQAKND
jgi:hypothetical protein